MSRCLHRTHRVRFGLCVSCPKISTSIREESGVSTMRSVVVVLTTALDTCRVLGWPRNLAPSHCYISTIPPPFRLPRRLDCREGWCEAQMRTCKVIARIAQRARCPIGSKVARDASVARRPWPYAIECRDRAIHRGVQAVLQIGSRFV